MTSQNGGDNSEEEAAGAEQAQVRAGYKELLDNIAGNEEDCGDLKSPSLLGYMTANEQLFEKVAAPQEAVMDARVIKQLSRLCRTQAEQMSSNINQFQQQEFAEKLVSNMTGGEGGVVSRKKWILLGRQVKGMFRRSPPLTYMYGALDTIPPPPKEKPAKEPRARQATRVADLVATQDTVLAEAEKSENQTEQMVTHVFKCLIACWKEAQKKPINFFKFVIDPDSFGSSIENLFHVSFLVKDGRVAIKVDDTSGMPHIVPVGRRQGTEGGSETKNQVVMNFCMDDWKKLKDSLGIRTCMIQKIESEKNDDRAASSKKPRH